MSRRHRIKHLTSDELKSKLYAHFQKTGSLDHLRSQLRGQLVSELFKVAEPIDAEKFPDTSDVDKCLLPLQVCNWLIYDHLSRQDYQYSLSTFVTETQLPYPEKFLTAGDVMRILGLHKNTSDFEKISKLYTEKNELEYLHSLLLAILKTLFKIPNKDYSLNENVVQENAANPSNKKDDITDQKDLNDSFIENRSGVHNASHIGEFSKSKEPILNTSFLSSYDARIGDLSFQEQLQSVKKESEREVQRLRHRLLEELENLHSQERKMQLELEFSKAELKRDQSRLLKEKEMFKDKEVLLEKEITNKYEMKMRDLESDFAAKLHFKDKEIQSLKAKLAEKEQKLAQAETGLSNERDSCNFINQELEDLKHMYKIIQDKYAAVLDENTNLLKKFENLSDYAVLKDELFLKSNEVKRLQNEIKDNHQRSEAERRKYVETVRNLEENLNLKEPQLIRARKELEHLQDTFNAEKSLWSKERKKLEQELSEFRDLYKTMIQKMEDQNENIQDLHQTIHILNYKLTNNVINVAKSDSLRSFKATQLSAKGSLIGKPEYLFAKQNTFLQPSPEKYSDSSLKFLSDAKNRFGKLKQEESTVQEKYSYIFSSLPDFNKQSHPYWENFNVSVPKSGMGDTFTPVSKFTSATSYGFSYNDWSKSKMTSSLKSPYSLSDVKRMVSNSLFPYRTSNLPDFNSGIGNIGTNKSSVLNTEESNFAGIRKETDVEFSGLINNKQFNFPLQNDHVSVSSTSQQSPVHEHFSEETSGLETHKATDKNHGQNYNTVSNSTQKVCINDYGKIPDKRLLENESAQDLERDLGTTLERVVPSLSDSNKMMVPPPLTKTQVEMSKNYSHQNKSTIEETTKDDNKSDETHNDNVTSEMHPKQNPSPFINLDAAWKQRSALPPLFSQPDRTIKEMDIRKSNDSNSLSYDNANKSKQNSNVQKPEAETEKDVEISNQVVPKPTINPDTEITKTGSDTTSNIQRDDKCVEIEKSREKEFKTDPVINSSSSKISKVDPEIPTDINKPENEKSYEKIASADSLSELSEIHLSCGSEAEQQKEDSDAW